MSTLRKTAALSIAGLGESANGKQIRMSRSEVVTTATGAYFKLLGKTIKTSSATIDPLNGHTTQGTISAEIIGLTNTAQEGDTVQAFLMASRAEPVAVLTGALTAGDTTVDVTPLPGAASIAAGDTVHIGRESMYVTNNSIGGGLFGYDELTVTRGAFGTIDVAHPVGPRDDIDVYSSDVANGSGTSIVEGREVTVYIYDHDTSTESTYWSGYLESPEKTGGKIKVSARDMWSRTFGKKIGEGALTCPGVMYTMDDRSGVILATRSPVVVQYEPILISGTKMMVSDGDFIVPAEMADDGPTSTWRSTTVSLAEYPDSTDLVASGYPLLFAGTPPDVHDAPNFNDSTIREVIVSAPGFSHFRDSSGALSSHPFDILVCILTSTGTATWSSVPTFTAGRNGNQDCLPEPWGLGIDVSLVDVAGIDALIASGPYQGLTAESLVLGEDGPVDVQGLFDQIFQSTFTFPAINSSGQMTIRDLRDPGTGNADFTLGESEILSAEKVPTSHTRSTWPLIRQLVVKVGKSGLGDSYAKHLIGADFQDFNTKNNEAHSVDVEIDAGIFGQVVGQGVAAPYRLDQLKNLYAWRYQLQSDPLPVYKLGITGDQGIITAGSTVEITHPGLLDRDATSGITSHRCMVIDATVKLDDFSQRITVIDLFPVTRSAQNTAPAWQVATVASTTSFTVTAAHFTADDAAEWVSPSRVLLLDKHGAIRSVDGYSTGSISGVTVTLTGAWQDSGDVTIAVGDIVIPAEYDDKDTAWATAAYIADSSGGLGAAADTPHRWGF